MEQKADGTWDNLQHGFGGDTLLNAEDLPGYYAHDLPGYYAAPASEHESRRRPLVVVGGSEDASVDEVEPSDGIQSGTPSTQQLLPADERSASHRIRCWRSL